jgi:hypothetical protein
MPDTALNNVQPIRFEAGGVFRISDGSTDYALRNREKGTLRIRAGTYEPLDWQELGVNKVPLEGDEQMTEIEIECKASKNEATSIYTLLVKRNTVSNQGLVYTYTVAIDVPDYRGATTGSRFTFASTYVVPDGIEYQAGERFDILRMRFRSCSKFAAPTTY